jgi:putative iron-regulated protein
VFRVIHAHGCYSTLAALLLASVGFFAGASSQASQGSPSDAEQGSLRRSVVRHYADLVHANYADALAAARKLETAVESFLAKPSESALNQARQGWIDARLPYLQTEACRFYEGPIDEVEGFINAWPIDENLIDYVADDPKAGIINDPLKYPVITTELIAELNEKQGERSITTGFHAIEFLLWGQDQRADGPGERSWKDYTEAKSAVRRGAYLRVATQLLVTHLRQVTAAWAPDQTNNYRAQFLALDPTVAMGRILKGLGSLSGPELSGERLTVAYQTKEQEDEHSCFSDTTHLDVQYDALGIENIYFGRYVRTDGTRVVGSGIHDLLTKEQPALAATLSGQIRESVRAARAIPSPFDQVVLGADTTPGRQAVRQAIKAFQYQADTIAKVAAALGIPLNL